MTAIEAIGAIGKHGIDVLVDGGGTLTLQHREPGRRIPRDVLTIAFEHRFAIYAFVSEWNAPPARYDWVL